MKSSLIASRLYRIANGISNSKNPSKSLVAKDLQKLIMATYGVHRIEDLGTINLKQATLESEYEPSEPDPDSMIDAISELISRSNIDFATRATDEGIGEYEYWGARGVDRNIVFDMDLPDDSVKVELSFGEPRNPEIEKAWMQEYLYDKEGKPNLEVTSIHNIEGDEDSRPGTPKVTVEISWKLIEHNNYTLVFEPTNWKQIR